MFNIINGLFSLGMLLSGCINTISKKAQNDSYAAGWGGIYHKFKHPWFQTIIMFFGEALCIFGYMIQRRNARIQRLQQLHLQQTTATQTTPLVDSGKPQPPDESTRKIFQPLLLIPTVLDLLGTTFGGIGLVYVAASIWQMLRGSIIVFTGILSWLFLKRKMLPYRWVSITFTILGLVCVGLTGMLNAKDDENKKKASASEGSSSSSGGQKDEVPLYMVAVGILLILCGQLVGAMQMVVEEKLLKNKNFAPLHIVGLEGIFGALAMAFVVLPICFFIPGDNPSPMHYPSYDNSIDALIQIGNNWRLLLYTLLYLLSIAFYNFFGLSVTKHLTCVHRTLIDACRTILVWSFQLLVHYAFDKSAGERWTRWSYIQVIGFALLITGTVLYNGIIKIPYMQYEAPAAPKAVETQKTSSDTTPLLGSTKPKDSQQQ